MSQEVLSIVGDTALQHTSATETEVCRLSEKLDGAIVGLYFSAHWCPPCRGFTPSLVKFYNSMKEKGQKFEVIFVTSDSDDDSFKKYYAIMPWLALPFKDQRIRRLSDHFSVRGIPTLVLLDHDGSVITTAGTSLLMGDPTGAEFPWRGKTPLSSAGGPSVLHLVFLAIFIYYIYTWLFAQNKP
eukprot:GGOE01036458.1.p1 GENE.GGOE01036458.1~~GGOE01036458.1.p1  ORF type:complete len:184 (-),score=58.05 GGOE01036458.1:138-689(-)